MSYTSDEVVDGMLEALRARKIELEEDHALPIMVEEIERWIAYVEAADKAANPDAYDDNEGAENDDTPENDNEGAENDDEGAGFSNNGVTLNPLLTSTARHHDEHWWADVEDEDAPAIMPIIVAPVVVAANPIDSGTGFGPPSGG